ncbi:MAG: hypothetical protein WC729_14025 [Sphingomonas sp.]|jgi:hypothetical protein|uniref:hypothetical protein n=1 Tax=Sphingomonas sp. TaxID=28214 RepID=UPI003567F2EF
MITWPNIIAAVALGFSLGCFYLFVKDAVGAKPETVEVAKRMQTLAPTIDLLAIIKAMADAFSKLRPGLSALLGAIMFLLLSGAAVGVYTFTA